VSTPEGMPRFGAIERIGAPKHPLRELYASLLERSWAWVVALLFTLFLLGNLLFALLYLAGDGAIAGARPGSFADAFAFSVQTFATIGYGGLTPATPWAHALVTVEAMVGMLFTALATGLCFAKFSRPRSHVVFSRVAVVTIYEGQPTLLFRAANARGNEVVEANMSVVLLKFETTPEGHGMRRLIDVPLRRSRSPMFLLSWTAMHPIDASSPLAGLGPAELEACRATLIVTLTGHDGTYAQTVHARAAYHWDEIRFGERLVDVVRTRADGVVELDYRRFHDTEPDPVWPGGRGAPPPPPASRPSEPAIG
jgi:inward rectifier potassium channel